ncbi:MAG: bifunctional folylpolyglutamate synthase/dihydrofolate synthase [Oscillospiraceae bacterium]|nr:bifunctional folylpolyglutamate synthase/dihydrofolate synthase [Oscillospiraceae bacterium]
MTADEAIKFIHSRLWRGSKPGLQRTRALLDAIGAPDKRLKFVHVAGTNGKGSTCALIAAALTAAGVKTGLFTSPYIYDFSERIRIDGAPISDAALGETTERFVPVVEAMADKPTEFELITALALEYFARENVDAVVLETGLGGRLDSTNVIERPLLSVITNIGLDHTRELGDSVEKIAAEKAGIIKPGCPTVIYELPKAPRRVIEERCSRVGSELVCADFSLISPISDSLDGQEFSYKDFERLFIPLLGENQLKNAACALEALKLLRGSGFSISGDAISRGFAATRWPARFELVCEEPYFVVDGGHNPQGARTAAASLRRYFPDRKAVILFGVLAHKDYAGMAAALAEAADDFVTITPPGERALSAQTLAETLRSLGKRAVTADSIAAGIEKAQSLASRDGVVLSVGSLYTAGEVRAYFGKRG